MLPRRSFQARRNSAHMHKWTKSCACLTLVCRLRLPSARVDRRWCPLFCYSHSHATVRRHRRTTSSTVNSRPSGTTSNMYLFLEDGIRKRRRHPCVPPHVCCPRRRRLLWGDAATLGSQRQTRVANLPNGQRVQTLCSLYRMAAQPAAILVVGGRRRGRRPPAMKRGWRSRLRTKRVYSPARVC